MPSIWWRCAILRRMRSHHVAVGFAVLLGTIFPSHVLSRSPQQSPTPQPAAGPDSQVQPGTPTGEVIKGEFDQSKVYPGTWREYWVYIPKQLDRAKPAPVMVFQDGLQYNAPVVFDNLIHKKDVPPIVGVFVMHGRVKASSNDALDRMNRSCRIRLGERRLRAVPARRDCCRTSRRRMA